MAFSKLLSNLIVQFTTQGLEAAKAGTETIKEALNSTADVANATGQSVKASLQGAFPVAGPSSTGVKTWLEDIKNQAAAASTALSQRMSSVRLPPRQPQAAFLGLAGNVAATGAKFNADPVVQGVATVRSMLSGLQSQANAVGGVVAARLNATTKAFGNILAAELTPKIKQTTDQLIAHIAQTRNYTAEQAAAFRKTIENSTALTLTRERIEKLQESTRAYTAATAIGFAAVTGTIGGFVAAGLHSSAMGQILTLRMQQMSGAVAGLFRPEIQKAIDMVSGLTSWIRNLSEGQRTTLALTLEFAATWLGVSMILSSVLPKLYGTYQGLRTLAAGIGLVKAAQASAAVVGAGSAAAGAASAATAGGTAAAATSWLGPLALAIGAVAAAAVAIYSLWPSSDDKSGSRGPMAPTFGGIGDPTQAYFQTLEQSRLITATDTGTSEQLKTQRAMRELLEQIERNTHRPGILP
jgi:hypothetical protein